jgi:hypothetical protein
VKDAVLLERDVSNKLAMTFESRVRSGRSNGISLITCKIQAKRMRR